MDKDESDFKRISPSITDPKLNWWANYNTRCRVKYITNFEWWSYIQKYA